MSKSMSSMMMVMVRMRRRRRRRAMVATLLSTSEASTEAFSVSFPNYSRTTFRPIRCSGRACTNPPGPRISGKSWEELPCRWARRPRFSIKYFGSASTLWCPGRVFRTVVSWSCPGR